VSKTKRIEKQHTFNTKSIQPKKYLKFLEKITTKIFFWLDRIVKKVFLFFVVFVVFVV